VTVDPLSQGAVRIPGKGEQSAAGDLEDVGLAGPVGLEADRCLARDGVDGQGVDHVAVDGVDGESDHGVPCG